LIRRIVSGGQTGVDRAALDAARAAGLDIGGWCPRGRRAEDGRVPDIYPLRETEARGYGTRTRDNVRDSDATLILNLGVLEGGTALTMRCAEELRRPYLLVALDADADAAAARRWIAERDVAVLNVGGPRESRRPGVYALARAFMDRLLAARP
jgi:hypothetical protein